MTAADALGYGSCYIGDILENCDIQREILGLPKVPGGDVFINRGEYMVLDMEGNVVYVSGGNLATALPPSDIEDNPMFDLGGDDDIYEDVDGKYEDDVDEG